MTRKLKMVLGTKPEEEKLTLRTLFFVITVNGTSSQIICITGRTRHKETLSVLP